MVVFKIVYYNYVVFYVSLLVSTKQKKKKKYHSKHPNEKEKEIKA
jgi:hypothetical protein